MTFLMTGVAGYIGSVCAYNFMQRGYKVVGIDDISTGAKYAVDYLKQNSNFSFYEGDFADNNLLEKIAKENNIECIVHFAANTQVFESTQNPLKYYTNNVCKMVKLLEFANLHNINNFIFSSSAATYGNLIKDEIFEDDIKNPINPYGSTKLIGEMMLKEFSDSKQDFNYIALRYFNVAGASLQAKLGQYNPSTLLIKIAAQTASKQREKMYLYGDTYNTSDGSCIRDFIHVDDLANAHFCAYEYLKENKKSDYFNVGYSKGTSVKEVIKIMKEVSGVDFNVELAGKRAGDPDCLVANCDKIKKLTKWQAKYDDIKLICKSAYEWELFLKQIKGI